MSRVYRKEGTSRRIELVSGSWIRMISREAGVSHENDGLFESRNLSPENMEGGVDLADGMNLIERVESSSGGMLSRCVLVWGSARHHLSDGEIEREWHTTEARLAMEIEREGRALMIDLGGSAPSEISIEPVERGVDLLGCPAAELDEPLGRVPLAPEAVAVLTAALMGMNKTVVQDARAGSIDGCGEVVESLNGAPDREWPNWYRPSYRSRPVRMPFDVRFDLAVARERTPVFDPKSGFALVSRLEAIEGEMRAELVIRTPAGVARVVVRGKPERWVSALESAGGERLWFPFNAGVWGEWATLASDQLEVERLGPWIE